MIEIYILSIFLSLIFIFTIYILFNNFSYNHLKSELEKLESSYYFVPKLDLEVLTTSEILTNIYNYKETRNPKIFKNERDSFEIDKNYIILAILKTNSKFTSHSLIQIINDINKILIRSCKVQRDNNFISNSINSIFKNTLRKLSNLYDLYIIFLVVITLLYVYYISKINLNDSKFSEIFSSTNIPLIFILFSLFSLFFYTYNRFLKFTKLTYDFSLVEDELLDKIEINRIHNHDVSYQSNNSTSIEVNNILSKLESNLNYQNKILTNQEKLFTNLNNQNIDHITNFSHTVVSQIETSLNSLDNFSKNIQVFGTFLNSSARLLELSETFLEKVSNLELDFKKISSTITDRLNVSGKLLEFLGSHLSTLENRREDMLSVIIATDNALKESYKELANSEKEILYNFKESTEKNSEEYKKIITEFVKHTEEISRNLISVMQKLDINMNKYYSITTNETFEASDSLFKLETQLSLLGEKWIERQEKFFNKLETGLQVPNNSTSSSMVSSGLSSESELQKLLTQININQIYFENILKEILKDLRRESLLKTNSGSLFENFKAKFKKNS